MTKMNIKTTQKEVKTSWCNQCKMNKPVGDFYRFKGRKSGIFYHCKACQAIWNSTYHKSPAGRLSARLSAKRMKEKYPLRKLARQRFRYHVKMGHIIKPEFCTSVMSDHCNGRFEAHHYKGYDGDNWKEVLWLCQKHHKAVHKNPPEQYTLPDEYYLNLYRENNNKRGREWRLKNHDYVLERDRQRYIRRHLTKGHQAQ